jgi:hypothetical protein
MLKIKYYSNSKNSRWMATRNRIDDINSRYQRVDSQNQFQPPVEFRRSEVATTTITRNVMHPTITNENPRYLNSLIANPIGSHFANKRDEGVTHGITRSRVIVTQQPAIIETTTTPPRVY